jgi:hypothetical protein
MESLKTEQGSNRMPPLLRYVVLFALFAAGCSKPATSDETAGPAAAPSSTAAASAERYQPQVGDVLFQSLPHGTLIDTIEAATHSPFSHCGIVADGPRGWVVVEANGSVKEMKLEDWLGQGREGAFVACRFTSKYAEKAPQVVAEARKYLGKPYDVHYDFDDEKIYYSELVFKAFKTVCGEECGKVVTLGDLDWRPHERVIRFIEAGGLPLERRMITPKHLAEAEQLQPVFRKGL